MKRKNLITATLALATGLFIFTSCENVQTDDSNLLNDLAVESAEDDVTVDDLYNSLDSEIDQELANLEITGYQSSMMKSTDEDPYVCKTITVDHPDTTTFPKTITIDYGDGCTIAIQGEEYTRTGKIIIVLTDKWFLEGASRTVTFEDFYINEVKIEGVRTVTNSGENEEGNLEFDVTLVEGKVIFNDTMEYTREAEKTREWVRAANPIDDIWYVTGGCSGVNVDGYEYSHTIIEELMIIRCQEFNYRWAIVDGVVELVKNGETATIDYGDGTCDGAAVLSRNGEQRQVRVRHRYHHRRRLFAGVNGN